MDDGELRTMAVKLALESARDTLVTVEGIVEKAEKIYEFLSDTQPKKEDDKDTE